MPNYDKSLDLEGHESINSEGPHTFEFVRRKQEQHEEGIRCKICAYALGQRNVDSNARL